DGFEATAAIRAAEAGRGRRTPVVALTAHAMAGDRDECLRRGLDDYVAKPVEPRELARVLARFRPQVETGGPWAVGRGQSEATSPAAPCPSPPALGCVFDAAAFRARCGGRDGLV